MATIASLVVKIAADTAELRTNMEKATSTIEKTAKVMAAAWVVREVVQATMAVVDYASTINDMSQRTGIGTKALQELKFAAGEVGVGFDSVVGAIGQMQNRLSSGDKSAVGAVRELGLSFKELQSLAPEAQFSAIASKINAVQDPADRVRIAMDLFGRSGAHMLPLLASDLDETKARFAELGLEIDGRTIKAMDDFGDAIDRVEVGGSALVARALSPMIEALGSLNGVTKASGGVMGILETHISALNMVVGGFVQRIGNLTGIDAVQKFGAAWRDAAIGVDAALTPIPPKSAAADAAMRVHAAEVAKTAEQYAKLTQATESRLFGGDALEKAKLYAEVIGNVANVTRMTATAQEDANRVFVAAVAALDAAGEGAGRTAQKYREFAAATTNLADLFPKVISGLSNLPGIEVPLPSLEALQASAATLTAGLYQTIAETAPAAAEAAKAPATAIEQEFAQAFTQIEMMARSSAQMIRDAMVMDLDAEINAQRGNGFMSQFQRGQASKLRDDAGRRGQFERIPGFAEGVTNFRGGMAIVGERGPELVNLPRGSSVTPNNALGGDTIIVNINAPVANPAAMGRQIADALVAERKSKGRRF